MGGYARVVNLRFGKWERVLNLMIFFKSDLHLGHTNAIRHNSRPFSSLEEMNEGIIERFNAKVKPNHSVYILGDVFWGTGLEANVVLRRLNGKKFLVKGNHDVKFLNAPEFDQSIFEWVQDIAYVKYKKKMFVLCHYPMFEWLGYYRGYIHLYGHLHNRYVRGEEKYNKSRLALLDGNAINVGVDVNDYTPVLADEIIERVMQSSEQAGSGRKMP